MCRCSDFLLHGMAKGDDVRDHWKSGVLIISLLPADTPAARSSLLAVTDMIYCLQRLSRMANMIPGDDASNERSE